MDYEEWKLLLQPFNTKSKAKKKKKKETQTYTLRQSETESLPSKKAERAGELEKNIRS